MWGEGKESSEWTERRAGGWLGRGLDGPVGRWTDAGGHLGGRLAGGRDGGGWMVAGQRREGWGVDGRTKGAQDNSP